MRVLLESLATVAVAIVVLVGLENLALRSAFPKLERLTTDFSSAYLRRDLTRLAGRPPQAVFLGDSVLWGYRLEPDQTAVSLLAAGGCACDNLALKAGSPPNDYALALLIEQQHIRPGVVVLEINQKAFNVADPSYRSLHPGIAALTAPLLSPDDRAALVVPGPPPGVLGEFDRALAWASTAYAMRTDIRAVLYGEDAGTETRARAAAFEGAYDLTPLDRHNVGVRYVEKALDVFRRAHVPVVAFMTPTNHTLMHEFIDAGPEYRANGEYLKGLAREHGARVLDLDTAVPAGEFFDNAHLTAAGQRRLAALLAPALPGPAPRLR